jgi:DNA-binding CsgD family transcriptional regulator
MRASARREDICTFFRRQGWLVNVYDPLFFGHASPAPKDADLLLVDANSLGSNESRISALRKHLGPRIPCIVLGMEFAAEPKAGALFGLPTSATLQEIGALAINCIHDMRRTSQANPWLLSGRELSVFSLIGEGLSNVHIAVKLGISVKTVEAHKENMKRKLKVATAEDLRIAAIEWTARRNTAALS